MGGFETTADSHGTAVGVAYLTFSTRGDKQGFEGNSRAKALSSVAVAGEVHQIFNKTLSFQLVSSYLEKEERLQPTGRKAFSSALKSGKQSAEHSRYLPVFLI